MVNAYTIYLLARWTKEHGIPVLPGILDRVNRILLGCWFPHSIRAAGRVQLGYGGLGIVVHGECVLGDDVHLCQHVTIGGNAIDKGVPVIGDRVYVGAGACVLGPITVGSGTVIGANSVVIKDIPDNSLVVGSPGRVIRQINRDTLLYHIRSRKDDETSAVKLYSPVE